MISRCSAVGACRKVRRASTKGSQICCASSGPRRQKAFGCCATDLRLFRYSYFGTYATLPGHEGFSSALRSYGVSAVWEAKVLETRRAKPMTPARTRQRYTADSDRSGSAPPLRVNCSANVRAQVVAATGEAPA